MSYDNVDNICIGLNRSGEKIKFVVAVVENEWHRNCCTTIAELIDDRGDWQGLICDQLF